MANEATAAPVHAGPGLDAWKHRRRIVYGTCCYTAVMVAWLTERHPESIVVAQTVSALILLAGGVIATYIGGAVVDDWFKRRNPA